MRGDWRSQVEVQSNFENRIRYGYGYPTKITVPSVFTGCNLTNKKLSTAMEINITISCFAWFTVLSPLQYKSRDPY